MRYLPTMDDMAILAQVGLEEPPETSIRLLMLRRELKECVFARPGDVVDFCMAIETNRSQLDRQFRHAMGMLAERQEEVETLRELLAARAANPPAGRRWWWFRS